MTNSEEEKYDLIERYVNRLLSSEEQKAFESEMSQDPLLKRDVDAYAEAQQLIMDQGILNVKVKLQAIHQAESAKVNGRKYYLPGAVLVIVSATLLYLYVTSSPQKVLQDTKTLATLDSIVRVENAAHTETNSAKENPTEKSNNTQTNQSPVSSSSQNKTDAQQNINTTVDTVFSQKSTDPVVTQKGNITKNDPDPVIATPVVKTDKVDCATIAIRGTVTTKETCAGETNGNIIVNLNSLRGGTKPYKFSLDKDEDFNTTSQFTELSAGNYQVFVKDKNNCISSLEKTEVKSKICLPESAFNPEIESWKIPGDHFTGELRILNRANEKVFNAFIKNGAPEYWNGTDNNGTTLPAGVYLYMLVSETGEINKSHVTILR